MDDEGRLFELIVTHGYRGILGREPDTMGKEAYVRFLQDGGSCLDFCRRLTGSREFKGRRAPLPMEELAANLFRSILNREPDSGELRRTIEEIQKGRMAEWAAAMLESNEFKNKFWRKRGQTKKSDKKI